MDELADIELVIENACSAFTIAVDGGLAPPFAGGAFNALLIELLGNRFWRMPDSIVFHYAADDSCLGFIDDAIASNRLATAVELTHDIITI